MEQAYRQAYNAAYTPDTYKRYLARLEEALGVPIPFRVAETPLFIPPGLRDRLAKHANEIVAQISQPALIDKLCRAVPAHLDVPGRDAIANCIQVDFAIVRGADGELDGRLVELQGFPSLYCLTPYQAGAMEAELRTIPGLDREWTPLFNGLDREQYIALLREAIVADCDPREVILMDLDPTQQKTYPDFVATKKLLDVDAVCPTTLIREGRKLFREVDGKLVPVRRIFNRVVFDELIQKNVKLPFDYRDELDVSWASHPNWYWIWSKYTVPHLDHPSVPRARLLSELTSIPDDLSNYVLKPLFSFAGAGVKVDITREDIDSVPDHEREGWMLQEKITYEPGLLTPEGHGVKAEIRMMFLRAPGMETPKLVLNLTRLSRGKMLGVDQNKDFDWVGGSVGLWPVNS